MSFSEECSDTQTMSAKEIFDDTQTMSVLDVCSDTPTMSAKEIFDESQTMYVSEICDDTQTMAVSEICDDTQTMAVSEICDDTQTMAVSEICDDTQTMAVSEICEGTQMPVLDICDDIQTISVVEVCDKKTNSVEVCDFLMSVTEVMLMGMMVTIATLGVILSWICETLSYHVTPILAWSSTSVRYIMNLILLRLSRTFRSVFRREDQAVDGAAIPAQGYWQGIFCPPGSTAHTVAAYTSGALLAGLQYARYGSRWLVTACVFCCRRLLGASVLWLEKFGSALRRGTRNFDERSSRAMQSPFVLAYMLTHRAYNVLVGRVFPSAFVLLAVGGERVKELVRGILSFFGKLISHARSRIKGSRFIKEKSRWLAPLVPWRMFVPRFNPQCGFSFIIGAAFLFLICYLYISHGTRVGRSFKLGHLEARLQNGARLQGSGRRSSVPSIKKKMPKPQEWGEGTAKNKSEVGGTMSWRHVSDVIGLMAQMGPIDHSAGMPAVQSEVLMRQIKELTEAMLSEKTMLPKLGDPPMCVGDLKEWEVEDILCIPKPKYVSHIKNPCWYTDETVGEVKVNKLNCLPYFHILGCAKSGTTDLWNRLMSHPHVVSNDGLLHKEGLWWSWRRYGFSGYNRHKVMNFSEYVDLFQDTARQIQALMEADSLLQQIIITGDASPPDFWDFRGWTNISQNRDQNIPRVITPHLMKHFYTNPKFILMFRDPIDRLYSDYFFVGGGLTSLDFHNDVLASINMVHSCVKQHGLVNCFFDHRLYVKLPVRLPFACYSVFMREWLQVFPLENFLFIKTEEYDEAPEETLKHVMAFLGLGPLRENVMQEITEEERARITVQRKIAGPMRNATKEILHTLLDPCSVELARLLKNKKFTWS